MKRVALFFDGKNFDLGRKAEAPDIAIDMARVATWLVERVGAEELWGAYYYTGVEVADPTTGQLDSRQLGLTGFLTMLGYLPGFFVRTFPRRQQTSRCPHCGEISSFSIEKEVDTAIVADMLRLAAVDAFDIAILMSGDADFAPGVDGVRALGKKVYIGSWGTTALSNRLREVAFDVIDLRDGIDTFLREARPMITPTRPVEPVPVEPAVEAEVAEPEPGFPVAIEPAEPVVVTELPPATPTSATEPVPIPEPAIEPEPVAPPRAMPAPEPLTRRQLLEMEIEEAEPKRQDPEAFLIELRRAQAHFRPPLYVGRSFFLRNWRSDILDDSFSVREALLERLVNAGVVEIYDSPDGTSRAIRIVDDPAEVGPGHGLIGRLQ